MLCWLAYCVRAYYLCVWLLVQKNTTIHTIQRRQSGVEDRLYTKDGRDFLGLKHCFVELL